MGLTNFPILATENNAFDLLDKITQAGSKFNATHLPKIEAAQRLAEQYLDDSWLDEVATQKKKLAMTPKQFQYNINSQARNNTQHIVLPEGDDKRVVQAAGKSLGF